jgi:hypothetical protein
LLLLDPSLPSSLVQLRIAVWTGDPRDTRPEPVMRVAVQHCTDLASRAHHV